MDVYNFDDSRIWRCSTSYCSRKNISHHRYLPCNRLVRVRIRNDIEYFYQNGGAIGLKLRKVKIDYISYSQKRAESTIVVQSQKIFWILFRIQVGRGIRYRRIDGSLESETQKGGPNRNVCALFKEVICDRKQSHSSYIKIIMSSHSWTYFCSWRNHCKVCYFILNMISKNEVPDKFYILLTGHV